MTGSTAIILAGGKARRMGGGDKAAVLLAGRPMIAHVVARLAAQTDQMVIAGRQDFGTGLSTLADDPAFEGPVAAIFGAAQWAETQGLTHLVTVPADGPFLPDDLATKLGTTGDGSSIAADENGMHPTFARWALADLNKARAGLAKAPSLHRLAEVTGAVTISWPGTRHFFNVNSPEDLASAEEWAG